MQNLNKFIFIHFTLFFFSISFAQNIKIKQNDIDSIYTMAISERLDLALTKGYKYIDLENQANVSQKKFSQSVIKILPQSEIIKISRKENKELEVYTIEYHAISKDTVNIFFGRYYLRAFNKKSKKQPLAEIREMKLEQKKPDIQFVLIDNEWKIIKSIYINR